MTSVQILLHNYDTVYSVKQRESKTEISCFSLVSRASSVYKKEKKNNNSLSHRIFRYKEYNTKRFENVSFSYCVSAFITRSVVNFQFQTPMIFVRFNETFWIRFFRDNNTFQIIINIENKIVHPPLIFDFRRTIIPYTDAFFSFDYYYIYFKLPLQLLTRPTIFITIH
jgi:hypothetical protein